MTLHCSGVSSVMLKKEDSVQRTADLLDANLFLQNCFFPLDLREAFDECFPLLAFCVKAFDLKSQLLQLSLTYLQSL